MGSFDRFDMKYALSILFKNSGILAVCKRAGLPITETGYVVRIATKGLSLSPAEKFQAQKLDCVDSWQSSSCHTRGLEGAELLVDDLPYNLIALHFSKCTCPTVPALEILTLQNA
jgi:hypothetical protein